MDSGAILRTAEFAKAQESLRELDPSNSLGSTISSPGWVPSQRDINQVYDEIARLSQERITNTLMPGGNPIGEMGNSYRVRILEDDLSKAQSDFDFLRKGGMLDPDITYPGMKVILPNNAGVLGFRPVSKSGPPTIDINNKIIPFKEVKYNGKIS